MSLNVSSTGNATRPSKPVNTSQRRVILHYHLFKNAGTSLDAIFKRSFAGSWASTEFPDAAGGNSPLVADWIEANPDVTVFSSHTATGPVPQIDGVAVFPVIFLRDPIERIRSAYRFERRQDADTWGAELAKQHDFEGYVNARLARPNDRQCRNFQTYRLTKFRRSLPTEIECAMEAVRTLPFVGLVDDFANSIRRLTEQLEAFGLPLSMDAVHLNQARQEFPAAVLPELLVANRDDLALVRYAREMIASR